MRFIGITAYTDVTVALYGGTRLAVPVLAALSVCYINYLLFMPIIIRGCIIKKLPIIFITLLISATLYAQQRAPAEVLFHNFRWGTSIQEFKARMGEPVHVENNNGLQSLIYDNIVVSGYPVFMLVYFSQNGLEGGTYYFNTFSLDELMKCYTDVQKELLDRYGSTLLCDLMYREMRPFETSWDLPTGYIHLRVNTRQNDPVTLWFSSPSLTRRLNGS